MFLDSYIDYKRKYQGLLRLCSFLGMIFFFMSSACLVSAHACVEEELDTARELAQVISEDWEDDYFEEMVIHEDSNQIEIDGTTDRFTDTFDCDKSTMREAVSSGENLKDFLSEQQKDSGEIYEVEDEKDGSYTVTQPYQAKRIVIRGKKVSSDYGAEAKYVCKEGDETILCFATDEQTRQAYRKICQVYGEEDCYIDEIISMNNLSQSYSWGAETMGMSSLKTDSRILGSSASVTVAVIDTGLNKSSSIFSGRTILSNSYNFVNGNKNITDSNGHGTHVAGIIADLTPNNVRLLILRISGEDGTSSALVVDLAMTYAVNQGVDVINCSYGFVTTDASRYTFLDDAIDRAYEKGIPVCAAAGNETNDVPGLSVNNCYPACNEQTVAVSAIDSDMNLASYSYYGKGIDFTAPGTNITSAGLSSKNGYQATMSGTSMAAPHISAAMAYIKLLHKNLSVQGACLELKKYCIDLGAAGKDSYYGYGCPVLTKLCDSTSTYASWTVSSMLASPKLVSCKNAEKGVELKWNRVKGASGYYVYRRQYNGVLKKLASLSGSTLHYVDSKVSEADINSYYVVAYAKKDGLLTLSGRSNSAMILVLKKLKLSGWKVRKGKVTFKKKKQLTWVDKKLEIQYSTDKSFKKKKSKSLQALSNTIRFTIKKKGTVYIRVRSKYRYQGKTYYSAWTRVKKIKVT